MTLLDSTIAPGQSGHIGDHEQIAAKLNAIYDVVADYGADRTGVVDAGAAIQQALDDAEAAGGGLVYVPAGIYSTATEITVPPNVQLVGAGRFIATVIVTADVIGIMLEAPGENSVGGIQLVAGVATTKAAFQVSDGTLAGNWVITDVRVMRTSGVLQFDTGIKTMGAISGIIQNALVQQCGSYGLDLVKVGAAPPNAIRFVNVDVQSAGVADIRVSDSDGAVLLDGITVQGTSPIGLLLDGCRDAVVTCAYYENGSSAGLSLVDCIGTTVIGGYYSDGLDTAITIGSGCGTTTLVNPRIDGPTNHIVNNSTSTLTIHGGSFDSSKCVGLTNDRTTGVWQDTSAGGNFRVIFKAPGGSAAGRPTAAAAGPGGVYYNSTLGRLQESNGTAWVDPVDPPPPLPPSAFEVSAGSPSKSSLLSGRRSAWLFDAATDELIVTEVMFAPNLNGRVLNVYFEWSNNGAGAGAVKWNAILLKTTDGATLSPSTDTLTATVTAGAQDTRKSSAIGSFAVDSSKLYSIRVQRDADDAADTLANDAALLLVRFALV